MKRVLAVLAVAVVGLAAVLVGRALMLRPPSPPAVSPAPKVSVDAQATAQLLSAFVKCKTISAPGMRDEAQFEALYELLRTSFPQFHAKATLERPGGALLYTLPGSDPAAPPVILMAHHDVVPVEPGSETRWTHEPWSGEIAEGSVWGRGAMDDKGSLVTLLKAIEDGLVAGWTPKHTVMVVSGHDEESGGSGAAAVAALLQSRGVKPLLVLDEGLVVTKGVVPGVEPRVAMVGVSEKGFLTLELSNVGEGGHSSMPPPQTATGIIAAAIAKIEANPFPARLDTPAGMMFDAIGPYLPFSSRLAVANQWLLGGVLTAQLSKKPSGSALVRTTTAATMFTGSVKDNVLPQRAMATVNVRILPGETRDSVIARLKHVIDDGRVEVRPAESLQSEASPVSRVDGAGYKVLSTSIRQIFPDAILAPALVVGATDARAFSSMSDQVFRFAPAVLGQADLAFLHGTNEHATIEQLGKMVEFYRTLLIDLDGI